MTQLIDFSLIEGFTMESKVQFFTDCVKAFPLIAPGDLAQFIGSVIISTRGLSGDVERLKTFKLIMANQPAFSFTNTAQLNDVIANLEEFDANWMLSPLEYVYWGGKEGLLPLFKKNVINRFPAIKWKGISDKYWELSSEVWQYMENKEPFSKEKKSD